MINVLYPNLISDTHYFACLKVFVSFMLTPYSFLVNLYTLTDPFLDPTTTHFPSGETQTALDLAASLRSDVLASMSSFT